MLICSYIPVFIHRTWYTYHVINSLNLGSMSTNLRLSDETK